MNADFVDNVIASLKIVAMVQKNQKLRVHKGQLTIEGSGRMQFLRRWVNNDSRDVILMHVRNTVNNAIRIARGLMDVVGHAGAAPSGHAPCFRDWTLTRIMQELEGARHGLVNLKTTYSDDSVMIANLDVLVDRVAINCEDISRAISAADLAEGSGAVTFAGPEVFRTLNDSSGETLKPC